MSNLEEMQEDEYRRAIIKDRINHLANNFNKAIEHNRQKRPVQRRII